MDLRTFFRAGRSRGGNSLRSGIQYEIQLHKRLRSLRYDGTRIGVGDMAGGTHGQDVPTQIGGRTINWEAKNKGAFEGGGTTLYEENGMLRVPVKAPLLQTLFADYRPWNGNIPAKGKMTEDDYIDVPSDSIAQYYREKGTHYISVEGKGIYHVGEDILNLGVPFFIVPGLRLRTRVTKHMKNGSPTDISTALTFNRRHLDPSPYSLFDKLPPGFTEEVE